MYKDQGILMSEDVWKLFATLPGLSGLLASSTFTKIGRAHGRKGDKNEI
jgi:hypothetical protein